MLNLIRTLIAVLCLFRVVKLLPVDINIGGLFEVGYEDLEQAFDHAVQKINENYTLLSESRLFAQKENIEQKNSFQASKKVCRLLQKGIAAIFGPQSSYTSALVGSLLDTFDIPHIETRWDFRRRINDYSINLYPHWETLSKAYRDLVTAKGWKSFTILYEENEALIRMQWLLQSTSGKDRDVSLRKLKPEYRPILKKVKDSRVRNIILDCKIENLKTILTQAQQIGIMTNYHSYILINLDAHTIDLEEFKYSQTDITGFRLIDPENPLVKEISNELAYKTRRSNKKLKQDYIINTQTGLMFDAVTIFSNALNDLDRSQSINVKSIFCDGGTPWSYGNSLINYMKIKTVNGLTGNIKFDQNGFRSDFVIDIVELEKDGLVKRAQWSRETRLNFTVKKDFNMKDANSSIRNKTLRIITLLNEPYTMTKESSTKLDGNDQFEGYCVDLIKEIAKKLNFNYVIKVAKDNTQGKYNNETKHWTGMIGELINDTADLAMADLTITHEREKVVDFTMPFMNLGIGILFSKPSVSAPTLFSFLSPLHWQVWLYMLTAYLGVSLFLFLVARFSPYEWQCPRPCNQDSEILENQFTLMNSLWFIVGSLMQQGSDLAPKAWSTRMVAGTWWFFTLIMISSYTANLAAFLTVQKMVSPIESAEDLMQQTKIKYGCYADGSTEAFFNNSQMETYKRMWEFMESAKPSVFVKSGKEGIARVLKGGYAYLMESTSIEYVTQRTCNLTQIGGLLDSKGFGIATRQNSPYRQLISAAILQLQEETILDSLKIKWWKQKRNGATCNMESSPKEGSTGRAKELDLDNVGGVFVVLLCGIGVAIIIAFIEFVWKTQRRKEEGRDSLCSDMLKELKFAVSCESTIRQKSKKMNYNQPENNYNFVTFSSFPSMSSKEPLS